MSSIENVSKWGAILQNLTIAAMIGLPMAIIGNLLTSPITAESLSGTIPGIQIAPAVTQGQLFTVVALNLINPLVLVLTLNEMRKLFGRYRQGEILTDTCAGLIKRIGQGFLVLALVPFVLQPLLSVLLTMANPPGQRSISLSLNSDMLFFAIAGGLIIVVGWAMREASQVAAENRSFV